MLSPATIAEVKARADIVELVRGVTTIKRSGASYLALCPFHNEKTPSLSVRPDRNYFHCFGCRAAGGPIDFVMMNEGLSFPEAIRSLAERLGIDVEEGTVQAKEEADAKRKEEQDVYGIHALAVAFYVDRLWGTNPARGAVLALEELDNRGILARPDDGSPEGAALTAFKVGYAPAAWRGFTSYLERQRVSLALGVKAGLLIEHEGRFYDRFCHRLMFPVFDHLGRAVAFSGRILPEPEPEDRDQPTFTTIRKDGRKPGKYINSPESTIYTKGSCLFGLWQARDTIRERGEALLVEGNFDVFSLHARGVTNVVAPLGTAFTEPQARLLRRFTTHVVLGFDADDAGRKATKDARVPLRAAQIDARVLTFPPKTDPDLFVRRRGAEAVREAMAKAGGLYEHIITWLITSGETLAEKDRGVREVRKLITEQADPTVRDLFRAYADRVAASVAADGRGHDLRALEVAIQRALRPQANAEGASPLLEDGVSFAVVGAVLDVPAVATHPEAQPFLAALEGDMALAVVSAQEPSAMDVLERTPPALRPHVEHRLASPLYATVEAALAGMKANGARLMRRGLQAREEAARESLAQAQQAGDDAGVQAALTTLSTLAVERWRSRR